MKKKFSNFNIQNTHNQVLQKQFISFKIKKNLVVISDFEVSDFQINE